MERAARREERGRSGPVPTTLGVAALAVVLVVGLSGLASFRRVIAARERLVDVELEALVETARLRAVTEHAGRMRREYLVTGREERAEDAARSVAEARALAARAAARPETAALGAALLVEIDAQDARWLALLAERARGEPLAELARHFEGEIVPGRDQLDAAARALERVRQASFDDGKRALEAAARASFLGLVGATAAGLVLSALLWLLLRRSLAALRSSEARYRATFENAPVGIAHVSAAGEWLRVNPRYREILGYGEEELRALTPTDVTHPDDRQKGADLVARLHRGEIPSYGIEKRYVRKDGRVAWVNLTVSTVPGTAREPTYYIAVAEDIAARRAVEDELRAAVAARDEFLQIASHELRTPLTSLRLQVESMRSSLARPGADILRLGAKTDAALRQVQRLADLVEGLLDVTRLEEGALEIRPDEGDLVQAVRAAVERVASEVARRGVDLSVELPASAPARFDRGRVEQATGHLLSNALKYGQGKPIAVSLDVGDGVARISVRDRGIGVDPGERERIFGRFERAVSTAHYGGFGLGLFVARRIAEAHGGSVSVVSTPSEGATFVLALPVAGPAAAAGAGSAPGTG